MPLQEFAGFAPECDGIGAVCDSKIDGTRHAPPSLSVNAHPFTPVIAFEDVGRTQ